MSNTDDRLVMKAKEFSVPAIYEVVLRGHTGGRWVWYTHEVVEGSTGIRFIDIKTRKPVMISGTYIVTQVDSMEDEDE